MEFNIRKNSTLPVLKLSVIKDGRSDYHRFMSMIEESAIFFSMINVETGIPKITSRPAGFVEKVQISPEADPEYYIYYQFTAKNTNKVGRYEGQFLLRNSEGTLILPIREQLFINIQESFIADDLPYETCYVSEFDCCVKPYPTSVAISPTPTPTPTNTPVTPTPTSTPTPTPTQQPILDECTILMLSQTSLYAYYPSTNTKLLLTIDGLNNSLDIAHTTTKMWINGSSSIYEYNITLNPWSATFNRTINIPSEYIIGDGLGAISNTQVISTSQISGKIIILDLTTNTAVPTEIGTLNPNRVVLGDILLTTTNKIILTNLDIITGDEYITQYSYPSCTLEVEIKINPTISVANGLFTDNGNLYIASSTVNGPIYTIDLDYPYNITYVDNSSIRLEGASQVPNCNNVNLNLPPAPTPTPTPSPELFIVGIDIVVSTGSVIFDFVITLPRTIDVDYELSLTKSFNVVSGSSIVVDAIVTVPTGSLTGSTRVVIDEDWNNVAEGSQTLVVNHNTNGVIPAITETENIVYEFVPKVTNTATPTPTPTSTPTTTPTNTPTSTPTNTPTNTPTPTPTNTPTPTQSLPVVVGKVYYGKLSRQQINITDVNNFSILESNTILSKYLFFEMVPGYCYIVIPSTMTQPDLFKNSVDGCNGFTIPFVRVDDVTIIDSFGNSVIHYVYRSFVLTNSSVDVWVCN